LRFDAYRERDQAIQFNLGGIGVKEKKLNYTEHIELFAFASAAIANTLWDFTFTTTNPEIPSNASIYLQSAYWDSKGTLGTFDSGDVGDPNYTIGYNWGGNSIELTGPEVLIGTGRSVAGTVIELFEIGTLQDSAGCAAYLKFVWYA